MLSCSSSDTKYLAVRAWRDDSACRECVREIVGVGSDCFISEEGSLATIVPQVARPCHHSSLRVYPGGGGQRSPRTGPTRGVSKPGKSTPATQ